MWKLDEIEQQKGWKTGSSEKGVGDESISFHLVTFEGDAPPLRASDPPDFEFLGIVFYFNFIATRKNKNKNAKQYPTPTRNSWHHVAIGGGEAKKQKKTSTPYSTTSALLF